jgi:peptide-methionine (S)-S-oxide reductase
MTAIHPAVRPLATILAGIPLVLVCVSTVQAQPGPPQGQGAAAASTVTAATPVRTAVAVFAGGCFWCMEKPFDRLPGVLETVSGFTGGSIERPSYQEVVAGGTGHLEAVQVRYDPARVSYATLLETYWRQVDPFDGGGQFCDRGESYAPAIFVSGPVEQAAAEASRASLVRTFARPVAVTIRPAGAFWPAEDYHQDYYLKNPLRYRFYRSGCGRDARLEAVWGAPRGR